MDEFSIDHGVHQTAILFVRNQRSDAVLSQSLPIKRALHRESSAEQANGRDALAEDGVRNRVRDVQQGDRDCCLNLVGDDVHGVCADHHEVSACGFQTLGMLGEQLPGTYPIVLGLECFDFGEIQGIQEDARRVIAAKLVVHEFVGQAIPLQ